jgi:diguanylate cyclase (GGDEF)-like protein
VTIITAGNRRLRLLSIGLSLALAVTLGALAYGDWRSFQATRNLSRVVETWADSQRQAVAGLVLYAQTGSAGDFSSFEKEIGRSLALRPVRLLLGRPAPHPKEVARRLLVAGTDPLNLSAFVETLDPLLALDDLHEVLDLWRKSDVQVDSLLELAYRLRRDVSGAGRPSVAETLVQIRSATDELQHTTAELDAALASSRDRLRWRIVRKTVLAASFAVAPVVLPVARRRRGAPAAAQPEAKREDDEILSRIPFGVWQRDASGATRFANAALLSLFGADSPDGAVVRFERIVTPASLARARREREHHLEGEGSSFEIELQAQGQTRRRVLVSATPVRDETGKVESVIENYLDVGEADEPEHGDWGVGGNHVLGQFPVSVWTTDRDLRYTLVSGPSLPGVTPSPGMPVHDSYDSRTRPIEALRAHQRALRGDSGIFEHEVEGHVYRCVVRPLKNRAGEIEGTVGVGIEIADFKHNKVRLEQLASRDPLTDLFNRRYFEDELGKVLADCERNQTKGTLIWCDLDNFKDINDGLGHHTGDLFLKRVADAFRVEVRHSEVLARLGGDEFGVLLPDASVEDAAALARRLLESVRRETAAIKARGLRTSASIGIVAFPEHGSTTEDLLSRADVAMYQAKRDGRGRIEVFSYDDHLRPFLNRMHTADQVRACLEQDRMELHLEPICNLRDRTVARYEALLRMPDENGKFIAPESFLGICESFGLMREIDRWVIVKACEMLRYFRDRVMNIPIEINLSGAAFGDESILTLIGQEVRNGDINPGSLIFEISEKAAVADLRRARAFIEELRRLGCQFAVDDFGVGFCSFGYLRHLPVRYLKIDGSFVRGLQNDLVNQNLVRAIVEMSRSLGVTPVAEFVEDKRTAEWLLAESCLFGQGSYTGLARPMSEVLAEHATALDERWRAAGRLNVVAPQPGLAPLGVA